MIPFRQALFETTFNHFVTKRVTSVLWIVNLILTILLAVIVFFVSIFSVFSLLEQDQPGLALLVFLFAVFGVPLLTFLSLVVSRLIFEASVALVTIAENTMPNNVRTSQNAGENLAGNVSRADQQPMTKEPKRMVRPAPGFVDKLIGGYTVDEINDLQDEYDRTPNDFALEVLGVVDHKLWVKAGKPDLKPWIRLGLPDFELWLKHQAK